MIAVRQAGHVLRMWPSIILGAMAGVLVFPLSVTLWHDALRAYDDVHPVVVSTASLLDRQADSVTVSVQFSKVRDCEYVRVQAYGLDAAGRRHDAYAQRVDTPASNVTRPIGTYEPQTWRFWPVADAVRMLAYAAHSCDGRVVLSEFAEVPL